MKRTSLLIVFLLLAGMTVSAQNTDMSFYTREFNRSDTTIFELLDILQMVRDENTTGIGEFYHNAIRVYLRRLPNFGSNRERNAVEEAARLILRGLSTEKHTEAASYVWSFIQFFDIASVLNDGLIMYEALYTMGEIDGKMYASNIAAILDGYNERATTDQRVKSKVQRVVPGAVHALEVLAEPVGIRPVFFTSIGWYDPEVKAIASTALHNLMTANDEIIGDVISEVILNHFNLPNIKYTAWQEMLNSDTSNRAKSQVAMAAIEASYTFIASSAESQGLLRFMRLSAIDAIRQFGTENEAIYPYLERTYREAFETPNTDFEVIILVTRTLSALRTDEAVDLLTEFLRGLHSRRRSGPWGVPERDLMNIVIPAIASTGTQSRATIQLLTIISRNSLYTNAEQNWAGNALRILAGQ